MTSEDENKLIEESDDLVAAEYVVGVLSTEDRLKASTRIEHDQEFARLVEAWEARLSPLADGYRAVEPPATVKKVIDRILFRDNPSTTTVRGNLWQNLTFWRGLAAATFTLLIIAVAMPLIRQSPLESRTQLVASIVPKDSNVSYIAYYDPLTRQLSLSHLSGDRGAGHDFELWAIEGQAKPVSLGVIPSGKVVRVRIDSKIGHQLVKGGILAISVEPPGGSPTGQVTGPVVAAGGIHQI